MSALAQSLAGPVDLSRPFTRDEAYASGLTDRDLRSARYVRIFRNVYVQRSTTRTLATRTEAALRVAPPSAIASHHTAALLWGGTVPRSSVVHLTVPAGQDCQAAGLWTHRYRAPAAPVLRSGLRVTSPERTFCDLGRYLDLVELVTLGDRLVKRGVTSELRLVSAADDWPGPRRQRLQRAARLVREGVDSPPESRLRMLVVLGGLPEPVVNFIVRDPDTGAWLRRFELAYPALRLAIEYHGRWHRESDDIWSADIDRREELGRDDWRIVEVIAGGLDEDPSRTLRRVEAARRERGAAPTLRRSEEWRPYFPGMPATASSARR